MEMDKATELMAAHASALSPSAQMMSEKEKSQANLVASTNPSDLDNTLFSTNARLESEGKIYKICIECDTRGGPGGEMTIKVGSRVALRVKHLAWNFRANATFYVDYSPHRVYFDVLWDAHDWLYGNGQTATFLFKKAKSPASPPGASARFTPSYSPSDIVVHAWKLG